MDVPSSRFLRPALLALIALVPAACGGGGSPSSASGRTSGNFLVDSATLGDGVTWELNRIIEVTFNNPIDPDSVSFSTVQFTSPDTLQPVTGSFEIKPGSNDRTLAFRPACPTDSVNSNGAFRPGGMKYQLTIPKSSGFGSGVLRDIAGRTLSQSFSRTFYTPKGSGGSLFVDYVIGPPSLDSVRGVRWPQGLNFFTDPDPVVRIHFNQAVDARPSNINQDRIYLLYSKGEDGTPDGSVFLDTNRVPGSLSVEENCTLAGSVVVFRVSGLLPPNHNLRLVVEEDFSDITGQVNIGRLAIPDHKIPSLAEYYDDAQTDFGLIEVADEFQDFYDSSVGIDLDAATPLPMASVEDGYVQASFNFPGQFTTKDLIIDTGFTEVFTNSQTFFTDSRNTTFTVVNGVINCRNFTLADGSELRGRGRNPLVVYATGEVILDGTLNVSGNDAVWPTGLGSPQRPEGGANGECGGGAGGTSSQEVFQETHRGSSGDGPFGLTGSGGQGGEGGFQQAQFVGSSYDKELSNIITAGGGGGTFAKTANVGIHWTRFRRKDAMLDVDKKFTPDHHWEYHTAHDAQQAVYVPFASYGGEAGIRGSSFDSQKVLSGIDPERPRGVFGMEDQKIDIILGPNGNASDGWSTGGNTYNFNKAWTDPLQANPYLEGHPTDGPDGGSGGPSVFSDDGTTSNDFWGSRVNNDGTVTVGELLTGWAGAGGGASGDSVVMTRGDGGDAPTEDSFPDPNFPNGTTDTYRKGGPGGGAGGQVTIMAIGRIVIGNNATILANGGHGVGGESIGFTYGQISGSGGGSGGHIVIHSAREIDLSAIDITDGLQDGDTDFTVENSYYWQVPISGSFLSEVFRAIGGRRGWSASRLNKVDTLPSSTKFDGNDTYAIGRGGGGSNGLIQLHVPDPANDFIWPASKAAEIQNFVHNGDLNNPLDRDRLEEVLRVFAAPQPVVLVPFFSSQSMYMGKWVDTGMASLRQPTTGTGVDFPDYRSDLIQMLGFTPSDGLVESSSGKIIDLPKVLSGSAPALQLFEFEASIPDARTVFASHMHLLRQPRLLRGYEFRPNESSSLSFGIADASYDAASNVLTVVSNPGDGSMESAAGGSTWAIIPKFFRLVTSGLGNSLPDSASVRLEFQGAEESEPGSNVPGTPVPSPTTWTSDLADLQGLRFLRYRVLFEIDAQEEGVTLSNPRPLIEYFKVPFTW